MNAAADRPRRLAWPLLRRRIVDASQQTPDSYLSEEEKAALVFVNNVMADHEADRAEIEAAAGTDIWCCMQTHGKPAATPAEWWATVKDH